MRWPLFALWLLSLCACSLHMPGKSYRGELPPITPAETELSARLRGHVEMLGGKIGARTALEYPQKLEQAATYIEEQFRAMGYTTAPVAYTCRGVSVRNIEVTVAGSDPAAGVVVIGAHYDSAYDAPAANDNGTGVASMLELARLAKTWKPTHTIRFVAFVNEEPPYFGTAEMGSYVYAGVCQRRGDKVSAMLSLETMGYYSQKKGSQLYPWPLSLFYPDRGDFIGFGTRYEDRQLLYKIIGKFRETTQFPSEGAAMPATTEGIWFSDHWSFWEHGFPAIMVTDTAMFRYPFYHTLQDTPDKVDYDRLARVTEGLGRVLADLAGAK